MSGKIRNLQWLFCGILVVAVLEALILPSDFVGNDSMTLYWLNLYSIVTGLGGMFVLLRFFNFNIIRRSIKNADENEAMRLFCQWTMCRLGFLGVALWSNVALYFSSSYTDTPKYSVLILLVACVFCWPSRSELESIRNK